MSTFTVKQLEDKLVQLSSSQQSIQTLSLWIVHHRRSAKTIVQVWQKYFLKVDEKKKLVLVFLANDVLQTCRKQGSEFSTEFAAVLPSVLMALQSLPPSSSLVKGTLRVLGIWKEREVFPASYVQSLRKLLVPNSAKGSQSAISPSTAQDQQPSSSRAVLPITTDDLEMAISKFAKSVPTDTSLQGRVNALPREMTDPTLISNLKDMSAVEERLKDLSSALKLVASWDGRIVAEVEDRQELVAQLEGCALYQRQLIGQALTNQKECRRKLEAIGTVKRELLAQRDNFPDIVEGGSKSSESHASSATKRPMDDEGEQPVAKEAKDSQSDMISGESDMQISTPPALVTTPQPIAASPAPPLLQGPSAANAIPPASAISAPVAPSLPVSMAGLSNQNLTDLLGHVMMQPSNSIGSAPGMSATQPMGDMRPGFAGPMGAALSTSQPIGQDMTAQAMPFTGIPPQPNWPAQPGFPPTHFLQPQAFRPNQPPLFPGAPRGQV